MKIKLWKYSKIYSRPIRSKNQYTNLIWLVPKQRKLEPSGRTAWEAGGSLNRSRRELQPYGCLVEESCCSCGEGIGWVSIWGDFSSMQAPCKVAAVQVQELSWEPMLFGSSVENQRLFSETLSKENQRRGSSSPPIVTSVVLKGNMVNVNLCLRTVNIGINSFERLLFLKSKYTVLIKSKNQINVNRLPLWDEPPVHWKTCISQRAILDAEMSRGQERLQWWLWKINTVSKWFKCKH